MLSDKQWQLLTIEVSRFGNIELLSQGRLVEIDSWQFDQIDLSVRPEECFNTLLVPITDPDNQRRRRYVYGYGTDGFDQSSCLV